MNFMANRSTSGLLPGKHTQNTGKLNPTYLSGPALPMMYVSILTVPEENVPVDGTRTTDVQYVPAVLWATESKIGP